MSLLSAEAQEAMIQQLSGEEEVEAPEEEEQLEMDESEASAEIEEPDDEEEDQLEASEAEEEYDPEEGHRIPYGRFKQINDRRKDLEDQMTSRDRMIEEMKAKLNNKFGESSNREAEESYEDEASDEDPDSWESRMASLQDSNSRLEMKFARMELDEEIQGARKEFPDVPEDFLWDTIAKDGRVSALVAARQYSAFVAEIEEAAIARHLGERGEMEKKGKATAPPRPRSRGAASSSTRDAPQPENLDAAREAMLQYLRS